MSTASGPAAEAAGRSGLPASVNWGRVTLYYGVALLGPVLAALLTVGLGLRYGRDIATMAFASLAMWFPFIAGVLVEKRAGRRTILSRAWGSFRAAPGRSIGRIVGWSLAACALLAASLAVVGFAGVASGPPGVGRWATDADVTAAIRAAQPALPEGFTVTVPMILANTVVSGLMAAFTINAVFGFGEEYGWRGVLAEELAPLGAVRATGVGGVLWGLWHAPLIVLGHNYGPQWLLGIPLFVLFCVGMSFLLTAVRNRSGHVWAAAVVHGFLNAIAGPFTLLLVGADVLVSLPVGVLGFLAVSLAGVLAWMLFGRPPEGQGRTPEASVQSARP